MGYTNSSLISYKKISPNKTSPRNHVIDTITIHCMAGNLSVETCGNVFASSSAQASSNYGIGSDGRIAMYVEEKDRSWCSSNSANDNRAVTIEVANDGGGPNWHVSDKAMAALIKLTADICKRNNIKELKWKADKSLIGQVDKQNMTVHRWFQNKSCPGNYLYNKHSYIAQEVNKKLGVKSSSASKTKVTYTSHRITGNKWGNEITGYNTKDAMGYSGVIGKPIDKIAIKLSKGTITYTAHRTDGKWGGEITGFSTTDTNKYAGSGGKPIDAIAIKASGIIGTLKYRVHRKKDNKWGNWITGYSKTDSNKYAGVFGMEIDAVQIGIK